jgi:ectoine hydroxylase-related dioxygenase (phytanoyl-CoA dioxygenase family)
MDVSWLNDNDRPHSIAWLVSNRVKLNPAFGLLGIETELPGDVEISGAKLIVQFGPHRRVLPIEAARLEPSSNRLRLNLATHLVDNGPQTFSATLRLADDSQLDFGRIEFNIENIGALAEAVREDLIAFGTPAIIGACVDSWLFPPARGNAHAWFNRDRSITEIPLSMERAPSEEFARMHLIRWGFAVLNHRIPQATITAFREEYEAAVDNGTLNYVRGTSTRIHLAHRLPTGRKVWLDKTVLEFLREWFRDEPCACQTLLYIHGSQQDAHQDTIHLTPYPAGYMCGVWVSLQDIEPDSGELFVYPGSHRTPRLMTADLALEKTTSDYSAYSVFSEAIARTLEERGLQRLVYRPKAGQILVWHENLIHGGAPRTDPSRERHSIVSHYFARGSIAYYDARGEAAGLEQVE